MATTHTDRPSRVALPVNLLKSVIFEPLITGPLLLALTRGPESVRQFLLRPFDSNLLSINRAQRISSITTTLKWLFALGLISHVNRALNAWAWNYWYIRKQGTPWEFGSPGKEIIVITGGSSGFGHHMVQDFASLTKAKIVVIDVQELPEDLKSNPNIFYFKCDLTSNTSIASTASAVRAMVGHPTVLINNAGVGTAHTILETSDEWLQQIFHVNVISHFSLIREFLPAMLEERKGHIVTLASMASYTGTASLADYSATKAALLGLHESLVQELSHRYEHGECIQTTIVHPMWARTPLIKSWESSLAAANQNLLSPSHVADLVVKQVLDGRSGQIFVPARFARGKMLRAHPYWLQQLVRGGVQKATKPVS